MVKIIGKRCSVFFAVHLLLAAFPIFAADSPWPNPVDPLAGMGVNIHFTDRKPGELEMLSHAGFRWVRMDCSWAAIEKKPGVYNFTTYDRLLASLDKFHIRALLILDYGNKLYDCGLSPHTDEGRAAFARWAVATVTHFQGRGVVWEIWNEPNQEFWKPRPNADDYTKLAMKACQAIRLAAPFEMVVGPALSGSDMGFLETVVRARTLNYWSAITSHPYFRQGPESYGPLYDRIRTLIQKYAPPGKKVDVICGESGYSTSWWGISEQSPNTGATEPLYSNALSDVPLAINDEIQGKYLARLFLFNVMSGVPLTIWYDWRDDGVDSSNAEHHFGIVRYDYHAHNGEVYDRKPAYDAAQTYSSQLDGALFMKRLRNKSDEDFILCFAKNGEECFVAWTSNWASHEVTFSVPDGTYALTSFDGKVSKLIQAKGDNILLRLDGGPQYIKRMGP